VVAAGVRIDDDLGPEGSVQSEDRPPRVALLSQRNVDQRVWQASQFEFEDVIREVEDALLIAPAGRDIGEMAHLRRRALNRGRAILRQPRTSSMSVGSLDRDVDLFFGIFSSAHELAHLDRIRNWRSNSRTAVAFLVELWTTQLAQYQEELKRLRQFDHVFLFSRAALPALERLTGVPCSYLPAATDTLRFAPRTRPLSERPIDVLSYGRRVEGTHAALLEALESGQLFYTFTTGTGPFPITDYREHRVLLAQTLQRSRFTIVYRNNDNADRARLTGGEDSLTTRYFEAAATGTVILGSRPEVADFDSCFDWEDALVQIKAPEPRITHVLRELEESPQRLNDVRARSIMESLRRHDWVHRWLTILELVALSPSVATRHRLNRLEAQAAAMVTPSITEAGRSTG
jgi:hypothetical protein